LDSHAPIDVVILMLGTNDFKIEFNRSAKEIAEAINGLVELIQTKTVQYANITTKIILVSPILIDGDAPKYEEWYNGYYNEASVEKSRALAGYLEMVAQATGCTFIDAAQVAKAGQDGIHFDEASHQVLGELLSKQLQ
jgi:lysophospholipase L1-like esterase